MVLFITFTTITHALLFAYDEYVLNRKRANISQMQINSQSLDGVFYLAIVAMTLFTRYTEILGNVYIALSILSCISIIKNEYFYENLPRLERLVHAGLYVLHPLILYAFYSSWKLDFFTTNMTYWMIQLGYFALGFKTISFHIIYWNYIHDN